MKFCSEEKMTLSKFAIDEIFRYVEAAPDVREVLDSDELDHVKDRKQSGILKNRFFQPQHNRQRKTYRIQIVLNEKFSLYEFIDNITEHITGSYSINIDLGYFALKPTDGDTLRFIFPALCTSFISHTVVDSESRKEMMQSVKAADGNLLLTAFLAHQEDKSFSESGFVPRSPVMLETYITTF